MIRVKGLTINIRADMTDLPPLLVVHGLLSSRNHWLLNQNDLRKKYRLVIAELPGHGQAPCCEDAGQLAPDTLADELDKARQILNIKRWHICGASFGSGLTLRHAVRHPHAVGAQIWTNANRVLSDSSDTNVLDQIDKRCRAIQTNGISALRNEMFHPRHGIRFPENIRNQLVSDADSCDLTTIVALMRHTLTKLPMRDSFSRTNIPTLLINGTRESRFQSTRLAASELLPTMEVVDLHGGHAINIEQPVAFNTAALKFLSHHDALLE